MKLVYTMMHGQKNIKIHVTCFKLYVKWPYDGLMTETCRQYCLSILWHNGMSCTKTDNCLCRNTAVPPGVGAGKKLLWQTSRQELEKPIIVTKLTLCKTQDELAKRIYRICSRNLRTFFCILAAEKSGCVKYADFFLWRSWSGFYSSIIENTVRFVNILL
jgi:hypothetical protein